MDPYIYRAERNTRLPLQARPRRWPATFLRVPRNTRGTLGPRFPRGPFLLAGGRVHAATGPRLMVKTGRAHYRRPPRGGRRRAAQGDEDVRVALLLVGAMAAEGPPHQLRQRVAQRRRGEDVLAVLVEHRAPGKGPPGAERVAPLAGRMAGAAPPDVHVDGGVEVDIEAPPPWQPQLFAAGP